MTRTKKLMGTVSATALIAMSTVPAHAEGITAGASITNTVTVDYKIGTAQQSQVEASDTFTVDRKVNFTVEEVGGVTTTVSPGELEAVTTFDVTNLSNATINIGLSVSQQTGGTAANGDTDTFDVSNVKIYVESEATPNGFDASDVEVTHLSEITADEQRRVYVVTTIPLETGSPARNIVSGDVAGVTLTGQAREADAASAGTVLSTDSTNTAGVDTVLADGGDVNYDGLVSDDDDYTVLAAALTVEKTSKVFSDPVSGTDNPKLIPGAVVEYCIAVTNGAGATAEDIVVEDILPVEVEYLSSFGVVLNGTLTAGGVCDDDGPDSGSYAPLDREVSGTLDDLDAGETLTLIFQATINAD